MAELLQRLAVQRQVFCVTHQPLVAAAADHHFRVAKEVRDGRTHTRVSQLRDTQARQAELAELAQLHGPMPVYLQGIQVSLQH